MAWKPQGGGPWGGGGGGGGGPWGGGSGGGGGGFSGGPGQPDFDDMLRRGQERLKGFLPGGVGTPKGIVLAVLAVIAIWLATGIYRVETGQQGVVLLFGKVVQTTQPGLHWYFPSPIGYVLTPDVTNVRSVQIGYRSSGDTRLTARRPVPEESLMLTGDQNIADLQVTVQWKVKDAEQFLFNIRDPEQTVKAAAESAMREVIGQTNLQPALTGGKGPIEGRMRTLLQKILDDYQAGISIDRVQLLDVQPPAAVIDAFNEVQRARQDKERKQNEALAYRNKIVPTARGEAEKMLQDAEAYKERVTKEADGEAQKFLSVYETYKAAKDVTTQRLYLEAMEEILKGSSKVIIDSDGKGGGVVPYLPLPELKKRGATQ